MAQISDPQARRPVPARLVLLHQVPDLPPGSKVRVQGCVQTYIPSASSSSPPLLALHNRYPAPSGQAPVYADISAVLATLSHEELAVGAWLNLIGEVQRMSLPPSLRPQTKRDGDAPEDGAGRTKRRRSKWANVLRVTMLWSAGAIKVQEWERAAAGFIRANVLPA